GPEAGAPSLEKFLTLSEDQRLAAVQEFMAARYQDGYTKGVHDLDGSRIFAALAEIHLALQRARFHPSARACALVYWTRFCPAETRTLWGTKLRAFGERNRLFPGDPVQAGYVTALRQLIGGFLKSQPLYPESLATEAGEYLFHELSGGESFTVTREAGDLAAAFLRHLVTKGHEDTFTAARAALGGHPSSELELVRDWVRGFLLGRNTGHLPGRTGADDPAERLRGAPHLEETAALLFCGDDVPRSPVHAESSRILDGMMGAHPRIQANRYVFDYLDFTERLRRFEAEAVPRFEACHRIKGQLLDRERRRLRLDEFKPRVLSSFVRNQLIDRVYLPLVGDNLAKQVGAAGAAKRTDLMGLLLLISPPGYGKTTLLEYVASRLGLVFIKINGPAIGHGTTSLDPEEAPNAAAREEIQKLNLSLEMGDNVLLCVDDIQHCSPEFLQKFISLCDAQRKIEGVWRRQSRTYDLRGRKVVVVMAGNPYTESGQKFKLPDMLANRADTYNLGDIIGGSADYFKASYLENAVTSNAVLAPLANRSQKDVHSFIRLAETGDRDAEGFEGSYSAQEVEEITGVMKKLVSLREIILKVNLEYIHSAGQADDFRTEPPFRLQGSYRNMNRLAEKIVPIMNDQEVLELVTDHYRGESQTLTTGAEANLLKFKELLGLLSAGEQARWADIKKTYRQLVRGGDRSDPAGRIVSQLAGFQSGLEAIQETLAGAVARPPAPPSVVVNLEPVSRSLEALQSLLERRAGDAGTPATAAVDLTPIARGLESLREALTQKPSTAAPASEAASLREPLTAGLQALRDDLGRAITAVHSGTMADAMKRMEHEMEMVHSTLATLKDIAARQRDHLRTAEELLAVRAKQGVVEFEVTQEMLANERAFLDKFHQVLASRPGGEPPAGDRPA
ncbi:MAG: AAA family ATPase, partial [Limisphaerales bacterium]